jgi:hypothetical protein
MPLARIFGQSFGPLDDHADGRRRPMCPCRVLFIPIVVASLLVLLSLAAGSSADPLWIGGVYDGADYDDLLAVSSDLGSPRAPFSVSCTTRLVTRLVPPTGPACNDPGFGSALQTRSPPSSIPYSF